MAYLAGASESELQRMLTVLSLIAKNVIVTVFNVFQRMYADGFIKRTDGATKFEKLLRDATQKETIDIHDVEEIIDYMILTRRHLPTLEQLYNIANDRESKKVLRADDVKKMALNLSLCDVFGSIVPILHFINSHLEATYQKIEKEHKANSNATRKLENVRDVPDDTKEVFRDEKVHTWDAAEVHGVYKVVPIPADGDCLFTAISTWFKISKRFKDTPLANQCTPAFIRETACDMIDQNREMFIGLTIETETIDEYIAKLRRPTTWGGHPEIQAFLMKFDTLRIRVLHGVVDQSDKIKAYDEYTFKGKKYNERSDDSDMKAHTIVLRLAGDHYELFEEKS